MEWQKITLSYALNNHSFVIAPEVKCLLFNLIGEEGTEVKHLASKGRSEMFGFKKKKQGNKVT